MEGKSRMEHDRTAPGNRTRRGSADSVRRLESSLSMPVIGDSRVAVKLKTLGISLPFGIGNLSIEVDEVQQEAAWALYVELATRVATVPLEPGAGSAREALDSLHSLFETTRSVLRSAGAGAANGAHSVGPLAIDILNRGLRPLLVDWHTKLGAFERSQIQQQRERHGADADIVIDESGWEEREAFYAALETNRQAMLVYIGALATIAGVDDTRTRR